MYKHFFKRLLDILFSFFGIIVLAIPMLIISLIIVIDDPGPVFFKQKRVGIKKNGELTYFQLYKFRSMKISTPPDVPTHLLENPEQYITMVGGVLRKSSGDELLQVFHILSGKMSIIGPRPALWNQYDLISERDKYGANDVKPGLTGLAQINGRDALGIEDKAMYDGRYAVELSRGHFKGFAMDMRCFFGTIKFVLKHDGVVEGGRTDELKRDEKLQEKDVVSK